MRRNDIRALLTSPGHVLATRLHVCRFGTVWRPECIEDDCGYRGPLLASQARALAVAAEHRAKTAGTWRPAK